MELNTENNNNIQNAVLSDDETLSEIMEPVALIISTCAKTPKRWNILSESIDSFERFNTYPNVARKIVMYDGDDYSGFNQTKEKYNKLNYEFYRTATPRNLYTTKKLKTYRIVLSFMESLDILNDSSSINWVFRSEDDWIFYRSGFIESSMAIHKHNIDLNERGLIKQRYSKISVIHLRNMQYHEPYINMVDFCGGPHGDKYIDHGTKIYVANDSIYGDIRYVLSADIDPRYCTCYCHFGFNPNLMLKAPVYQHMQTCVNKLIENDYNGVNMEHCIGCQYKAAGYFKALVIDHGYVGHGGMIDNTYADRDKEMQHVNNISDIMKIPKKLTANLSMSRMNCTYIHH